MFFVRNRGLKTAGKYLCRSDKQREKGDGGGRRSGGRRGRERYGVTGRQAGRATLACGDICWPLSGLQIVSRSAGHAPYAPFLLSADAFAAATGCYCYSAPAKRFYQCVMLMCRVSDLLLLLPLMLLLVTATTTALTVTK